MTNTADSEVTLFGINASPGICIGSAYLLDHEGVDVVEKYFISKKDLNSEIKRFKVAVKKTKDELDQLIKDTPAELHQHTHILETHVMMLKDKMMYDKVLETCKKELVNAEWAVKKVLSRIQTMFQDMPNAYLKARASDIVHVADRVISHLVGSKKIDVSDITRRVVLVARDLSPADTSQINLEKIKGLVTDRGGRTSHTSIIAHSLGIPAVLAVGNATDLIKNDDLIIVDGTAGLVIVHPNEETLIQYEERIEKYKHYKDKITSESLSKAKTTDGFTIKVMGNIELPDEVASVLANGGEGIGLYRTEFQYLSSSTFPGEDELFEKYKYVVEALAPNQVIIRTLDINGDKAIASSKNTKEDNPALGLRAIRYCLRRPEVFKTQLRAILRAAALGNVGILFPMISTYEEILMAKKLLCEAADSLEKDQIVFNKDIDIGIMIEVPSAVILADMMADEVDFFSIGTNDLIQFALAIDRGNRDVAHLYNPLNPAVIRMIKQVADVAKNKGIKIHICGEMAADPIHIPILVGLGIDELSMNPQSIPAVKSMIRSISMHDAVLSAQTIINQKTSADVKKILMDTYGRIVADKLYKD
jgi:phosphotransferase system enzyme I (PtsI)